MTEKLCNKCKLTLPIDSFGNSKRDGYRPICKPCDRKSSRERYNRYKDVPGFKEKQNAREREYRRKNPRSYERRRAEWLKYKYSLTPDDYAKLLAAQNGVCAICQKECKTTKGLAIDHDHRCCPQDKSCGKCIRGLLCANCNGAIGMLQEDISIIKKAIEYLS
jgi:hypothetical protein